MEQHKLSKHISQLLAEAVSENVFPGAVVGVVTPKNRVVIPVGRFTYDPSSEEMTHDSIFDVASITKTVPTSLLALKLIETGKLSLDQKVQDILPEFRGAWKNTVTVWHLLTQTVDFGLRLSTLKNKTPDQIIESILTCDLVKKPGTDYSYTNSASIILGFVIEKITNTSLQELSESELFHPLQMGNTTFFPDRKKLQHIVPTEIDPWRKRIIRGEIHDESAYVLFQKKPVGSAGIFSIADDLLNVLEMLIHKGVFKGRRILSPKTISRLTKNELRDIASSSALGFERNQSYMGDSQSGQMIGKTGFTGCMIVCDIPRQVGIVLLSNYHFPKRKKTHARLHTLRRDIIDTVLTS